MTLIEMLENGINTQNWELIKNALVLIKGEDTKQEGVHEEKKENVGNGVMVIKQSPTRQPKKTPVKSQMKNKFVDDMSLHTEDIGIGVKQPRQRVNKGEKLVEVVCSMCGKHEKVAGILAMQYSESEEENMYRCDKCLTDSINR